MRANPRITGRATVVLALLTSLCLMLPPVSMDDLSVNVITLAWAFQDSPSGIYINRQFDWPTGEALWVDIPVWVVQIAVLVMTGAAAGIHWFALGDSTGRRR